LRSRNIKPGFFKNEILGTLEPLVGLTFAGLWTLADKRGRLEDRPIRIKGELFPYLDSVDVNGYFTVLEREGFIALRRRWRRTDSSSEIRGASPFLVGQILSRSLPDHLGEHRMPEGGVGQATPFLRAATGLYAGVS
jgi:hypothetical protein